MERKIEKLWNKAQQCFNNQQYRKAIQSISKIPKKELAANSNIEFLLAEAYFQNGDLVKSKYHAEVINARHPEQVHVNNLIGRIYFSIGNMPQAISAFEKSVNLDKNFNEYMNLALCKAYSSMHLYSQAIPILLKLKAISSHTLDASRLLMIAYQSLGMKDEARALASYLVMTAKINLKPEFIYRAFMILSDNGFIDELGILIELSKEIMKKQYFEEMMLVHYFHLKKYLNVIHLFKNTVIKDSLLNLVAESYHKLNDFDNAWLVYTSIANRNQQRLNSKSLESNILQKKFSFNKSADDIQLVLVAGFPRSGTTLIETCIDVDKSTLVLSEKPTMINVISHMETKFSKKFPKDIEHLTESELSQLRQIYLDYVSSLHPETEIATKIIVDKNPHATSLIPLYKMLFPSSKIIQPIRNPIDTCLSCFRQSFEDNASNNRLITIDSTFKTYMETFKLWWFFKENLNLDYLEVKYEDVVTQFDTTIKSVCDFIGIEFTKDMKNFHNYAQHQKHVRSASKDQVNKPLYNSSVNAWHAYRKYLEPYKEYVEPVAKRYGYDIG